MEPLTSTAAPVVATAPVAAPAPAPAAPAPAAPMAAPMTPPSSSGNFSDVFKRMNWIEVGFGVLGTAALYYTIFYYKWNITMSKTFNNEIQNKVDELTMKIADVSSAVENSQQPSQNQEFF